MDKQTLSNYGWLVIVTLILAVMLALATPFGTYVGDAVVSVANGFVGASNEAIDEDNIKTNGEKWDSKFDYSILEDDSGMSDVDPVLANNDWATIQAVAKANKVAEAGWSIGDTKSVEINGTEYDATIIGINHEGVNGITFMIVSSGGIGYHVMNTDLTNAGGWEDSEMREWLNENIYNTMSNKDYIKEVTKMTNNIGYRGNSVTGTQDKVFLLSPKEAGVEWQMADSHYWDWPDYVGMNALNSEGSTYTWFTTNTVDDYFWLRSPNSNSDSYFFYYDCGDLGYNDFADYENTVYPAFVIG